MHIDDLLSQTDFAAGQPVKKDIWNSEKFTVALICLEEGLEIPPHTEPFAAFFLVLEGKGVFTAGEGSFELGKNGSITINANETRGIKCLEKLVVLGIHDPHRH